MRLSRAQGVEYQALLVHFALERFLYRLAQTPHQRALFLRGPMLFNIWGAPGYRLNTSTELLSSEMQDATTWRAVLTAACAASVVPDGLTFLADTVEIAAVSGLAPQRRWRGTLWAAFGGRSRLRLRVDGVVGDVLPAAPNELDVPPLLSLPAARLRTTSRELVIANACEGLARLGTDFRHMRQIYEVAFLALTSAFGGGAVSAAINQTVRHRAVFVPETLPVLDDAFAADTLRAAEWNAFLRRIGVRDPTFTFGAVMGIVRGFLGPPLSALAQKRAFVLSWPVGGPWG